MLVTWKKTRPGDITTNHKPGEHTATRGDGAEDMLGPYRTGAELNRAICNAWKVDLRAYVGRTSDNLEVTVYDLEAASA